MRRPMRKPHYLELENVKNWRSPADYIMYRHGGSIHVIDGATGRILRSDTSAQEILEYLNDDVFTDNRAEGRSIFFKPGIYEIDGDLIFDKPDVQLVGGYTHGRNATHGIAIIKLADSANVTYGIVMSENNCGIHGMFIDGNKDNVTACDELLHLSGDDFVGRSSAVLYAKKHGIVIDGAYAHYYSNFASEYAEDFGWRLTSAYWCRFFNATGTGCATKAGYQLAGNSRMNVFHGCVSSASFGAFTLVATNAANTPHNNYFSGCHSNASTDSAFRLLGVQKNVFVGCLVNDASQTVDNTKDSFVLDTYAGVHSTHNRFIGCNAITSGGAKQHRYGFREEDANQDYNIYYGNYSENAQTANYSIQGANSIIRDALGYVNRNEGVSGVIADGATIAHGLASTPAGAIAVGTVAGEIVNVTALDAANITVAIKNNVGGAGANQAIYWRAWF